MTRYIFIVVGIFVLLGGWSWYQKQGGGDVSRMWGDTLVRCLPNGHENLALHIHPNLSVFVDGERETIPANIGILPLCMAEVHTHDTSGQIHIETVDASRTFTLSDFFAVWNTSLTREGYILSASLNGDVVEYPENIVLADHDTIILSYTRE